MTGVLMMTGLVLLILLGVATPQGALADTVGGPPADDLFADYDDNDGALTVPDPLQPVNQGIFTFNDRLYFWVLKPLATGYKRVAPLTLRQGIRHFFHHLLFPVRLVNALAQGKFGPAGREFQVFLIDSMGGLGFSAVAEKEHGLTGVDEDLGQTLGVYGAGHGCYLVLPLLGPSSLRDLLGRVGDYFLDPLSYVDAGTPAAVATALETVNGASLRLGDYEALKAAAFDPYIALRDGYFQLRDAQVRK